ncbi:phytanoyl-CoA dioxygenase [Pseudomonas aeruginosa]|uniref:Phytanoyl-CoA dioxygenase family protein n=1 Tax=Pseudomonas gessardii TaxID=78544 RepID=A0A7Y1QP16_9PSED|nr:MULTISPECIES: phytanoyl-CoA dioxygenase family protein [Pseudomonas]AVX93414.1 phytanoyl-CoA dioxygenase [Pseudomonas koreensis]OPK07257.1 phytanoyl-CoA dioxygenase [Pseudomonas veronii]ARH13584.1 phytanoyl-CoA dioxygenase [Pseudomonas aeruginosa]MCF5511991.1 phytanoyl-CoA dioxygenase family protein [Pseudomonas sp. PA-3-6H]MCF5565144.1 phytanoyl-CoA dioxygenase family protein [Pseudomonas sp. PA-3-5D]
MVPTHLPNTATPEQIDQSLRAHGYVIVEELVSGELMERIQDEMDCHVNETSWGKDTFLGPKTKRTGSIIARSVSARELVMNKTALGVAEKFLAHASTYQLLLTQIISVHPGSPAQPLHQDELVWDFFPFPDDYQVQCNILWAMTDYTEENGATRVVPNSQYAGRKKKYTQEDTIPAVMKRGSALFYTGKIYHGAGENKSDMVRQAMNITYSVGWVRQEENQYLATPMEIARTLPDDLLRLMGYQFGGFALGYTHNFEDPMVAVRGKSADNVDMSIEVVGAAIDTATTFRSEQKVVS